MSIFLYSVSFMSFGGRPLSVISSYRQVPSMKMSTCTCKCTHKEEWKTHIYHTIIHIIRTLNYVALLTKSDNLKSPNRYQIRSQVDELYVAMERAQHVVRSVRILDALVDGESSHVAIGGVDKNGLQLPLGANGPNVLIAKAERAGN